MNIFAAITPAIKNAVQVLINNNKNLKLKEGNTLDKEVKYLLLTDKGEYGWFYSRCFGIYGPYGPFKEVCEEEIITKILSFKPVPPKLVTFRYFVVSPEGRGLITKLISRLNISKDIYFKYYASEKDSCFFLKEIETGKKYFGWATKDSHIYTSEECVDINFTRTITEILNLQ